jgi:flavin reductase (DIM6/NTAB) family NADH-FMN oxidoreductase RutF
MNDSARTVIDPPLFRRVMGSFATGVTVITARDGEGVRGMTANAFMSGSLEPPLCVVSIARRAQMHDLMRSADNFGVSILAESQEDLSVHFAGRPDPGLAISFEWIAAVPLVRNACARIAAETIARHPCGDHTIFLGHILHMDASSRPPLIYHSGRYGALDRNRPEHDVGVPEFW